MKIFTDWPESEIVKRIVEQLPWRRNITLLERFDDAKTRLWHARQTRRQRQTEATKLDQNHNL
jgi:hypothetical protein